MRTEFRANKKPWSDEIELALFQIGQKGQFAIAKPPVMQTLERGGCIGEPTFTLKTSEAQFLMDELWRAGLRPSEGTGSAGALAATEKHLADMQVLAFKVLDKVLA